MEIIEIFKAVLFGVVEGITEWLPISSTGHMILLNEFVRLNVSKEFWSVFEVVIQLGAIMAVALLFWRRLWPFGHRDNTCPMARSGILSWIKKDVMVLWAKILTACIPAAVIGLVWGDLFEALFYNYFCVAVALIVFGVAFILIEERNGRRPSNDRRRRQFPGRADGRTVTSLDGLTWQICLIIGLFQVLAAVFPGTSRSGATIVGALLVGVSRVTAAEFTFYLAIPVMFCASMMKIAGFGLSFTESEIIILLTGMVVAFFVSLAVIRFLMEYVKKHDFKVFGWYRIVLGVIVLIQSVLRL